MLLVTDIPKAIMRYREIGGILDFAFFADMEGSIEDLLPAICYAIKQGTKGQIRPPYCTVDQVQLTALTSRELGLDEFLGSKVDIRRGDLRYNGEYTMTDGQTVVDPSYRQLGNLRREGIRIRSGGSWPSAEGGFGQAFAYQLYPLRGDPDQIQKVFEAVRALLLPPGRQCRILDWSGPQLSVLSNYFIGEQACWGECLFTVYVTQDRWLAVICGSASD